MEQEDKSQRHGSIYCAFAEDQSNAQNSKQLEEENHELNKLIEALVKENTSLKSQLNLQNSVDQYRQTLLEVQHQEDSKLVNNQRLRFKKKSSISSINFPSSAASVDNKQSKVSARNLIMDQTDLFYMLTAQASSLETLLLNNVN